MTDWRERISAQPDVLLGKPVIRGTRISVELVVDLLARGYSSEQVVAQYPHIDAADVQACLAYTLDWAGRFAIVENDRIRVRQLPG